MPHVPDLGMYNVQWSLGTAPEEFGVNTSGWFEWHGAKAGLSGLKVMASEYMYGIDRSSRKFQDYS
jgi:hypothetical protein